MAFMANFVLHYLSFDDYYDNNHLLKLKLCHYDLFHSFFLLALSLTLGWLLPRDTICKKLQFVEIEGVHGQQTLENAELSGEFPIILSSNSRYCPSAPIPVELNSLPFHQPHLGGHSDPFGTHL